MQFALFLAGCVWLALAWTAADHIAQGTADRLNLPYLFSFFQQVMLVLFLLAGFAVLDWIFSRTLSIRSANALPKRATAAQEWLRGAALGWGMLIAATVPMMLLGLLHPQFWSTPGSYGSMLLALATLALWTLALELAFRGYLFARLAMATGPVVATILLSFLYALLSAFRPEHTFLSVAVTFLMAVLFSAAYLRTHALWLGWGIHFAWDAATAVLLGLPIAGSTVYSSLVATSTSGPAWFTGGFYGPEGAVLTVVVVLAAMAVLYRITRGYAWEYTHAPIVPMGHAVIIAPPAAHTAMEDAAAVQPAPLVQILSTTSTQSSTMPVIDEHLRAGATADKSDR